MTLDGRNTLAGIAARTHKNLAFIADARTRGADVHVVTQLLLSLLGLVVFPVQDLRDRGATDLKTALLPELEREGWPSWRFTLEESPNLGHLLSRLRNAVAHRLMTFSSDSLDLNEVVITFRDRKNSQARYHWEATIRAADLVRFVELLSDFLGDRAPYFQR